MKQEGFKKRYVIRLASSAVIAVLNAVIQFLLPRALAVEDYGYYSYNLNVFTAVVGILNLQTADALISKFSKRNEEIGIIKFYYIFNFTIYVISTALLFALFNLNTFRETFAGQTLMMVILGFQSVYATRMLSECVSLYDAMALSKLPSIVQVIWKIIITVIIAGSYFAGKLTLELFYVVQITTTVCVAFVLLLLLIKIQRQDYPQGIDKGLKYYLSEFYHFCRPLVLANLVSQGTVIIMNWALMKWGGVTDQAMFGIAWQINTMVTLVFSSYAQLSKREFAVLIKDKESLRRRYIQSLKLMMWITCFFSIFIGFLSEWILPILYGNKYEQATLVTLLIMFYTVYQSWGQISGALQMAMEKTRVIAICTIVGQIIQLVCMYIFQIPNFIWSSGLGALGIALTYLCSNFLSVTIAIIVNARLLNASWTKDLCIQIFPIGICTILILAEKALIGSIIQNNTTIALLSRVFVSGLLYTAVLAFVIYRFPVLIGMNKVNIESIIKRVKG